MLLCSFYIFSGYGVLSKEENIRRNEILIKSWCFINVQLKTKNSASAIVHSCFSAANETSLCEPAFLFLCGPLTAKTGCTLHCFLTHCIHKQVAQRRNNGSPIHSIWAAFQVGLSQTFSHSQKGPEKGATIGFRTCEANYFVILCKCLIIITAIKDSLIWSLDDVLQKY